jgi:hypothetical protein
VRFPALADHAQVITARPAELIESDTRLVRLALKALNNAIARSS